MTHRNIHSTSTIFVDSRGNGHGGKMGARQCRIDRWMGKAARFGYNRGMVHPGLIGNSNVARAENSWRLLYHQRCELTDLRAWALNWCLAGLWLTLSTMDEEQDCER